MKSAFELAVFTQQVPGTRTLAKQSTQLFKWVLVSHNGDKPKRGSKPKKETDVLMITRKEKKNFFKSRQIRKRLIDSNEVGNK